jgi:ethanolamine utilization protein EutJ
LKVITSQDQRINPTRLLSRAQAVISDDLNNQSPLTSPPSNGRLQVGVDLCTAYTVLVVIDRSGEPIIGEYRFAKVVRDGLVLDYAGAVDLLRNMKSRVENHLSQPLIHAATGYPPGVPDAEVQATAHVIEAAGFACRGVIDEPSAANKVLNLQDGVIVDVGGGTTGIAILENGQVVHTADEATGGTHFTLVIAGALDISFEEAEALKIDPTEQTRLFPLVRPVMEKVGTIIANNIKGYDIQRINLVGGTALFPGIAGVIEEVVGLPTQAVHNPLFVTPLGIAMHDQEEAF